MSLGRATAWPSKFTNQHALAGLKKIAGLAASKIRIGSMSYQDKQETAYWQILFRLEALEKATNPSALAFTIARNHLLDLLAREKVVAQVPVSQLNPPGGSVSPDQWAEMPTDQQLVVFSGRAEVDKFFQTARLQKVITDVHDALAQLDDTKRTIVRGFFGIDGEPLTIRGLAGLLNCSEVWVKKLKAEALDKLRALLSAEGYS